MFEWVTPEHPILIHAAIAFALLAGAVGLPMPEDLPLLTGGILSSLGYVRFPTTIAVCYVAVVGGDLIIFWIGRRLGPRLFEKEWFKKRFSSSRLRRVRLNLEKRSLLMIFVARHLFYLRTATFLTCGAVKMSPERFLISDMFAALISVPLMVSLGYLASEHLDAVRHYVYQANFWLFVMIVVGTTGYWYFKKRTAKS